MPALKILVGNAVFIAELYDNETTRAFNSLLPLMVDMDELNSKEKYYRLDEELPVESTEKPKKIYAGEIMCWSSNTLVLFYNTFSNSFGGYVRVGYIEDVSGLASALGKGNVKVTFKLND